MQQAKNLTILMLKKYKEMVENDATSTVFSFIDYRDQILASMGEPKICPLCNYVNQKYGTKSPCDGCPIPKERWCDKKNSYFELIQTDCPKSVILKNVEELCEILS